MNGRTTYAEAAGMCILQGRVLCNQGCAGPRNICGYNDRWVWTRMPCNAQSNGPMAGAADWMGHDISRPVG